MKTYLSTDSKEDKTKASIELLNARKPSAEGWDTNHAAEKPFTRPGEWYKNDLRKLLEKMILAKVILGTSKRQRLFIPHGGQVCFNFKFQVNTS